jgi:mannose-6-phosphate isomerase-like protein (cupin superfamily)
MIDPAAVEHDWRARGFSFGIWTDPPGRVWENYTHATDELFMVMDGEVELEMQGRTLRPAAGDEMLIPARTLHTVRNVGARTARSLYGYQERRR